MLKTLQFILVKSHWAFSKPKSFFFKKKKKDSVGSVFS